MITERRLVLYTTIPCAGGGLECFDLVLGTGFPRYLAHWPTVAVNRLAACRSAVSRSFRAVFPRKLPQKKNLEMIVFIAAIDFVKFSSKSELSSRFFGRLNFSAVLGALMGH